MDKREPKLVGNALGHARAKPNTWNHVDDGAAGLDRVALVLEGARRRREALGKKAHTKPTAHSRSWGDTLTVVTTSRLTAPVLGPTDKLTGPVSYFPHIEAKYAQPMQHWIDLVVARLDAGDRHMAVVELLKAEHGMGHGHANAVVAWVRAGLAA